MKNEMDRRVFLFYYVGNLGADVSLCHRSAVFLATSAESINFFNQVGAAIPFF
jgi:hypothetical protein